MTHPLLYEVHTRQWLHELAAHGLGEVPNHELERLAQIGVTHLWLMGVWPTGPLAREQARGMRKEFDAALPGWTAADVAGSPYAIAEYRVAAEFGGDPALAAFRERLHRFGIGVILDFVPNHVGLDHDWIASDHVVWSPTPMSDAFHTGARWVAHGKDPYFAGWTDTAQIEYRRAETRDAMRAVLRSIADRCDGVRCDMAMLELSDVFAKTWSHLPGPPIPGEFWRDAIAGVRRDYPQFVFLAEAYWQREAELVGLGFDYAYDKDLYDRIVHDQPWQIGPHVRGADNRRRAHFLENHDEPRAALVPIDLHRAALVATLGLPGMRFLHHGQLDGARRFARIQLRRRALGAADPMDRDVHEMYARVLAAMRASSVGEGSHAGAAHDDATTGLVLEPHRAWADNATSECFVVVKWARDLVVVNFAPHRAQCRVHVPGVAGSRWQLVDRLGDERWTRDGTEMATPGLFLDLPARGAQIFGLQRIT